LGITTLNIKNPSATSILDSLDSWVAAKSLLRNQMIHGIDVEKPLVLAYV